MGLARVANSPTPNPRCFKVSRLHRHNAQQVRTLWWWSNRSRGWFSHDMDEMEERLRRHQALMMHRYHKALRRRALWDRDNSPCYSAWKLRGRRLERELSSTAPGRAKVEERDARKSQEQEPWKEFHKDFESFKRAVDRAVERDPYGTLFGRRLRSHETTNNSSWTSWSWIFDPKEIKKETQSEPSSTDRAFSKTETVDAAPEANESAEKPVRPTAFHSSAPGRTNTTLESSQHRAVSESSTMAADYVYDPISGRKIPQDTSVESATSASSPSTTSAPEENPPPAPQRDLSPKPSPKGVPIFSTKGQPNPRSPEKDALPSSLAKDRRNSPGTGFFKALFGEHGAEIPVKTYNPPKVYGFTGEKKDSPKPENAAEQKRLDSSKKREYDLLRLRTIGNNIDANNFNCEPWNNPVPGTPKPVETGTTVAQEPQLSSVHSEEAPLFSGTTYASRVGEIAQQLRESEDFLVKEGFRDRKGMTIPSLKNDTTPPVSQVNTTKLQPALDRASPAGVEIPVKKFASRLQPAVDRAVYPAKETSSAQERKEDIDLLRASDVRAAARVARITKQEIEDKKTSERKQMEKDFDAGHSEAADEKGIEATRHLSTVWQHISKHPDGVVARTMKNMGIVPTTEKPKQIVPKDSSAISEPTVKPGVKRDLVIEQYTQVFEPKIAAITDQLKKVRRETTEAARELDEILASRSDGASTKATQNQPLQAPFVLLSYNKDTADVTITPLDNLMGETQASETKVNAMAIISSLNNANAFVQHFAELDKNDYELTSGGGDVLVFQKRPLVKASQTVTSPLPSASVLRSTIAEAEAASQPQAQIKSAATVLDEIPSSIPVPGPAAPTAPSTAPPSRAPSTSATSGDAPPSSEVTTPTESTVQPPTTQQAPASPKSRSRVSRQEEVFSGQVRMPQQTTGLPDPEHFQKQTPVADPSAATSQWQDYEPQLGFFARLRRGVKRVVLTVVALSVGAYSVGAVAEAINSKAQIAGGDARGPMKKLVLEEGKRHGDRQRAGIFSTESSRR